MSSEMREEVVSLRRLAEVIRKYGTCAPAALETVANNIERLLARTEAGADGAAAWRNIDSAIDAKALATATEIALMWGRDRSQFVSRIQVAVIDAMRWIGEAYTHPQDASGDAVMTGPGDHDDLPAFLEWVAGEVVRRDTRAGNFAEGLAQSLRGRAHILRIVKNDAMQAKEAK